MRSKHRVRLLALMGVLVIGALAVGSASASAASWKVEGKELKTGEKAALVENMTTSTHIVFGKESGWKIECLTVSARSANLEGPNLYGAQSLKFGSCAFTAPISDKEKCSVSEGQFTTKAVTGTLTTSGTTAKLAIKPTNSELEFGDLKIVPKGAGTCVQEGTHSIKGVIGSEISSALVEQTSHLLNFTSTSGTALEYGSEPLLMSGQAELALTTGQKWAA